MAKIELGGLGSGYASTVKLNEQLQKIQDELNNKVLYRNNPSGESNSMSNDLDMNGYAILNLGASSDIAGKTYVDDQADAAEQAAKDFATTGDATVTASLQLYTDNGDAATLSSANAYTDVLRTYVDTQDDAHLLQATEYTDAKLAEYDPFSFLDYGLVTSTVATTNDYGSVV